MKRASAALMLLWWQGFVLATSRRGKPTDLGLPGGKVMPGEEPLMAAIRETAEETGVRVPPNDCARVFDRPDGTTSGRHVFVFMAYAPTPMFLQPEEGIYVAWVRPERLLHPNCSFREFNAQLFKHLKLDLTP